MNNNNAFMDQIRTLAFCSTIIAAFVSQETNRIPLSHTGGQPRKLLSTFNLGGTLFIHYLFPGCAITAGPL
jgi:hypothetical protein